MNDLLFYALLIALAYYFLVYLPSQKKPPLRPAPTTHSKSTQTDPIYTDYESGPTLNCPDPTEFPSAQSTLTPTDQKELENTLDQLIKGMQDLEKIL